MATIETSLCNSNTVDLRALNVTFPFSAPSQDHPAVDKVLAKIPGLHAEYESLKGVFEKPADTRYVTRLREFARDLFMSWEKCGQLFVAAYGFEQVIAPLELLASLRETVWDFEYLDYYNQLPERFTIYHGGIGTFEEVKQASSWCVQRSFAEMDMGKSKEGILIKATICKKDILMCSGSVSQVFPRPGSVRDIAQIR